MRTLPGRCLLLSPQDVLARGGAGGGVAGRVSLGSRKPGLGFLGSLLLGGRVLARSLGSQLQGLPLTVDRRYTAQQQSAHLVHWLPQRMEAPVPPGNHALHGSCHGR